MDFEIMDELRELRSPRFIQFAAEKYGMSVDSLNALLEDYDLYPLGAQGPSDSAPYPAKVKDVAKNVGLPQEVIYRFQDDQVVCNPMTYGDIDILEIICKIWGKAFYLKKQLAKFSKKQREDLINRPEFSTKWEKWVYSIYFKNEIAYEIGGRIIDPSKRIFIKDLAQTVESMFGVPDCFNLRERIKKIREIAENDKKKVKSRKATVESMCKYRDVPLNRVELEIGDSGEDVMYS